MKQMVEEKDKQVMGHLTFKDQAHLPHAQPHYEDAHLPAKQCSLWSPGKRDQRRLSQLTALASNSALLSPSLCVCCLPSCSAIFQKMENWSVNTLNL